MRLLPPLPSLPSLPPLGAASGHEDDYGYDPAFATAAAPVFDLLYARALRARATGLENVPSTGGALVVANHAGAPGWDAAVVARALARTSPPRTARLLLPAGVFSLPYVSVVLRRLGGVPAEPSTAVRLLRDGHVVVAFPEQGRRGAMYEVASFGRGEVVELALRAQAPLVPCAVVGGERVGPLPVPGPSRWHVGFGAPLSLGDLGPEAAEDRKTVLELADRLRAALQEKVHESLIQREGAFT